MQMQVEISPLSKMGQWQKALFDPSITNLNFAVIDLSYEIMINFLNEIRSDDRRRKNWETCIGLQFRKWKVKKRATLNEFVQILMKRNCKFEFLQNAAIQLDPLSFKKYFYGGKQPEYEMREKARIDADQNNSRGYLKDIASDTLREISDLLDEDFSWKKIGDGLGFNYFECFYFSNPLEMLKKWLLKFPDGTLDRIYFEVERLGFQKVCQYLDGIPLEKVSSIVCRNPYSFYPQLRPVTVFDLEKLEELYETSGINIDWAGISYLIFNSLDSKKEDIWLAGNIPIGQVVHILGACHKCFLIGYEHFEPRNSQGVTYNQMAFLAEAINSDSFMAEREFAELVRNKVSNCDFRVHQLSIRNFLSLYWQMNRELDLTQFFGKTMELLHPTAPSTGRILYYAFEVINPKRYHKSSLK